MYFIGNISTDALVERTGTYSDPPPRDYVLDRVSESTGIPVTGLFAYYEHDKAKVTRAAKGNSFNLIWSGVYWEQYESPSFPSGIPSGWTPSVIASGINREIVAVDFAPEDAKRWLSVTSNKTQIVADNVDTAQVRFFVHNADTTPNTTLNAVQNIVIGTPTGPAEARITIANGSGVLNLKTTQYGYWKFPANLNKYPNLRLYSDVEVLALLNM